MPFNSAIRKVCQTTGETAIRMEVLAVVRAALDSGAAHQQQAKQCTILVTGAAGFVGAALVSRLTSDVRLFAPPRSQLDLLNGSVDLDLTLREANIGVVVHLANPRIVTTNQSLGESLVLLKNVLDACRMNRSRLIYLSCWEVFSGYRSSGMLVDETTPMNPSGGTYSQAKYLAELLIEQYRRQFALHCVIVRSSPVYGESGRKPRFIANYIEKALAGTTIHTHCYRNGPPRLDLIHVDDLVTALRAIICEDVGDTFHIGPGSAASTAEIARMIVDLTGSASRIEPRDIDDFAASVILDATRLRDRFDWQPRVDLCTGLRRVVEKHIANSQVAKRGAA
jgi:UDP-glucuronate decarboxylase